MALAPVPEPRRHELLADVREHIAEARMALTDETDADLLNILDRLGDPQAMAAAEIGREDDSAPAARPRSRALEIAAIVLLLLFWPIGVVLLWISDAWSTRDKLIGTLVPPGGYLGILVLGPIVALGSFTAVCRTVTDEAGRVVSSTCPSAGAQTGIDVGVGLLLIFYLVAPILSAVYLAARLRRNRRMAEAAIPPSAVIATGAV